MDIEFCSYVKYFDIPIDNTDNILKIWGEIENTIVLNYFSPMLPPIYGKLYMIVTSLSL